MTVLDLLRRLPVFIAVYGIISLLNPGDPFYLNAGALEPHLWVSAILAVWLGLWATLVGTVGLAGAMLYAHSRTVDPLEAETIFTIRDWIVPVAMVLTSAVVAYLSDRLRDATRLAQLKLEGAENSLIELGKLHDQSNAVRDRLEQEIHTFTRTPAQIAAIAERFEVEDRSELLKNLLRVTTEHLRSRAAAIYEYDTFSSWKRVECRPGSWSAGVQSGAVAEVAEFPAVINDSDLQAAEREGLRELLRSSGQPGNTGSRAGWKSGKLVRPEDLVIAVGSVSQGGGSGGFHAVLIHRAVAFGDTSPGGRATFEALVRWASLVLKRTTGARK